MTWRRGGDTMPTLAIVDAFVGGVSIILVLILLTSFSSDVSGETPRADIVARCDPATGMLRLPDPYDMVVEPFEVVDVLRAKIPQSLALRILIVTEVSNFDCVIATNAALQLANRNAFRDGAERTAPVFIWDTRFEEPADAEPN